MSLLLAGVLLVLEAQHSDGIVKTCVYANAVHPVVITVPAYKVCPATMEWSY